MKRQMIWTLAALNVALAATLAYRGIAANAAHAQAAARPPMEAGRYVMIPGDSQSIGASIVFILDTANRRIGAIAPNARESIDVMPTLQLDPIFDAAQSGAGGPQVNPDAAQRNNRDNTNNNRNRPNQPAR